jgi:DNA polymerase-1
MSEAPKPKPSALPPAGSKDVLYVIDLSNYVFRAYHALPPLTSSHGEPTHATLGTMNMLNRMIEDYRPSYMAVAMDSRGRGFRGEIAPSYKANRPPAPADLSMQLVRCREIFEAYNVPIFTKEGFEADDVIATVVRKARAAGLRVVIASSDKDLLQLVDGKHVVCWDAMRNKVYGPLEVNDKYGVGPEHMRELLALVGDTSDNIPGVPGVGPKTAAQLLQKFGSLEQILGRASEIDKPKLRQAVVDHADEARLAYRLVELKDDVELELDLDKLRYGNPDVPRLRLLFTQLQFTRFLDLLAKFEAPVIEPPTQATKIHTVLDDSALDEIAARAIASKQLAVVALGPSQEAMRTPLTGIALATAEGEAYYLPLGHRTLIAPRQLSLAVVKAKLEAVLADDNIAKLGHDLKLTQVLLGRYGMPVRGARFDSMLASYLLDPESSHKLDLIAARDANMPWTELEKVVPRAGSRAPKHTIEELEVEQVAPHACAHAEAIQRLARAYRSKLGSMQLSALFDELEMPLSDVLMRMEQVGVRIDPAPLAALGERMSVELADLEKRAHELAGHEFNLASPKQLEALLYDELGLKPSRKTKTGRSTDAEALEAIAASHPLPQVILDHRSIAKLKGTYVDALPALIHPETGRIHTRWDQAVAATGRISSRDPNLQNIPVRNAHGKQIREAFVASPGMTILSADYSQIELRVLAHLSGDPVLVDAFRHDDDVHVRTAMAVFGVPREQVTPQMRAQSKTVNFGVIYGMGATSLAKQLGIARADAKHFIEAYFEKYSTVATFMTTTLEQARKSGEVRTLLGRRRLLPDLRSANPMKRSYAERIAQNTPIQGTAADLLKLAMVKLADPVVPGAQMVLTVHDELVFEVPEDRVEEAAKKTKAAMESIIELRVPLVVDVGYGKTWAAAH